MPGADGLRPGARLYRATYSRSSVQDRELDQEPGQAYDRRARQELGGNRMTATNLTIPPVEALRVEAYDVHKIRRDFPILARDVRGKKLVYLDNAATSQKPQAVIDAILRYYQEGNANVHRGVHFLSEHATGEHERARRTVQKFINAAHSNEIVFVRG